MSEYPEADKWAARSEERDVVTDFLEHLTGRNVELCEFKERGVDGWDGPTGYHPISETTDRLLYGYFDIDAKALEQERRAMLTTWQESGE